MEKRSHSSGFDSSGNVCKFARHKMKSPAPAIALSLLFAANLFAAKDVYRPMAVQPPDLPREFRGAWITEVASNADWPSQPGLSATEQKAELIALLDHAVQLHLNAIIFQVRPSADAVYASAIEPWSEYLTGVQGRPPAPYYDPLAFAIQEAHKRGLELHAWFNPFRVRLASAKSPPAWNDVIRTHPGFIRQYGDLTWLDPGDPAARAYVLSIVLDVVKRYDVDGVQFDDYFYPYPQTDAEGRPIEFPDYATWKKYGEPMHLSRADWRRANINRFIYGAYLSIKTEKPWVKFGVSPFGIWRPGYPPQIRGLDAYSSLSADSRLWLASGWVDYLSPQLSWAIASPQQSFPVLLDWWEEQNIKGRALWPGLSAAYVGRDFSADEIARQVQIVRETPGVNGEIYFHLKNLIENNELNSLVRAANKNSALVPAMPWLSTSVPDQPVLSVTKETITNLTFHWEPAAGESPKFWVLQYLGTNQVWTSEICPGIQSGCAFSTFRPGVVSIRALDDYENLSPAAVLGKFVVPTPIHRIGKGMLITQ